jgi:hypothetical protein
MPGNRSPGILVLRDVVRPDQLFFTSEQTLFSSGIKASSAGMVATSL